MSNYARIDEHTKTIFNCLTKNIIFKIIRYVMPIFVEYQIAMIFYLRVSLRNKVANWSKGHRIARPIFHKYMTRYIWYGYIGRIDVMLSELNSFGRICWKFKESCAHCGCRFNIYVTCVVCVVECFLNFFFCNNLKGKSTANSPLELCLLHVDKGFVFLSLIISYIEVYRLLWFWKFVGSSRCEHFVLNTNL